MDFLQSINWFLAAFICAVLIAAYYFARHFAIKRMGYTRYFAQSGVFQGEVAELVEEVSNNSPLPLLFVDVESFMPGELNLEGYPSDSRPMREFISRFHLAPFTRIRRTIRVGCSKRGDYTLETVSVRYLFTRIFIESKARLFVYPAAMPQVEKDPLQSDAQSLYLSERKLIQDPFSFSGIRDYRRGDPFRSINFKATAKNMALMVNTREFISVRNFMIYIDFHPKHGEARPDEFGGMMERAMALAADLLQKAIRSGCAAGFAANSRNSTGDIFVSYPMGAGYNHYTEILTEMAKIRLMAGKSLTAVMSADLNRLKHAEIFVYTLNAEQDFGGCLDVFRAMGNSVTVVQL